MNQMALALVSFDPRRSARRSDPSSSVIVAAERAENGRAAHEAEVVLRCLRQFPGATSAELAHWTADVGQSEFGQDAHAWRSTCARRLPGLEDRGLVYAVSPSFRVGGRTRRFDPNIAPCRVTVTANGKALRSLRWHLVREE